LYPNPAHELAYLEAPENGLISLYSYSGELLSQQKVYTGISMLNLNTVSNGLYFLIFQGEHHVYRSVKLTKE
jgi:hypothetical protein